MEIRSYEDIEPLPVEWLWPGYIPMGEVTIISGDSSVGKSFLMCDIAARVTRGFPMPLDEREDLPPGSVIMVTPEDIAETTLIHRLEAAEADLARVIDLTEVKRDIPIVSILSLAPESMADTFTLPTDLPLLERVIEERGDVRLVVLDPISAISEDLNTVRRVRYRLIRPLQQLARDTGIAVIIVHHPRKGESRRDAASMKESIGGSKAITDAARCVMSVVREESDPETRRLFNVKNNLAPEAPSLEYTIGETDDGVRVIWASEEKERKAERYITKEQADSVTKEERIVHIINAFEAEHARVPSFQELAQLSGLSYREVRLIVKHIIEAQAKSQEVASEMGATGPET